MKLKENRIKELDGLRGLAALFVVLYHYINRFQEKFDLQVFPSFLNFEFGHYGVQLFFMISGFVIFMSIRKEEGFLNPRSFIFRRFMRLFPTFWICLIITYFFVNYLGPDLLKASTKEFLVNFTMIPKLFKTNFVDGVYWTLSVEMFFYVIVLFLLIFNQMKNYKFYGIAFLILGIAQFLVGNIFVYYLHGLLFLIGMNFYSVWKNESNWLNYCQIFGSILLYGLYGNVELFFVIVVINIIFFLLVSKKLVFLSSKYFVVLGAISYPLYLLHQNIGHSIELWLLNRNVDNAILLFFIPFIFVLSISYVVTFYIEKPLIKFLNNRYSILK